MAIQMQQRRGTAAAWTAANPTLAAGEIGFETDTRKLKVGDGSTAWNSLGYDYSETAATRAETALGSIHAITSQYYI